MDDLKYRVICNMHFEDCMFKDRKTKSSLNANAVPIKYKRGTIQLPNNTIHTSEKTLTPAKEKPLNKVFSESTVTNILNSSRSSSSQNSSASNVNTSKIITKSYLSYAKKKSHPYPNPKTLKEMFIKSPSGKFSVRFCPSASQNLPSVNDSNDKIHTPKKTGTSAPKNPDHPRSNQVFTGFMTPMQARESPSHISPRKLNTNKVSAKRHILNAKKKSYPYLNEREISKSSSPVDELSTSQNLSSGNDFKDKVCTPKRTYLHPLQKSNFSNDEISKPTSLTSHSFTSPTIHILTPTCSSSTTKLNANSPNMFQTPKSTRYVRDLIDLPSKSFSVKRKLELNDADDTPKSKKLKIANRTIEQLRKMSHNKSTMINRLKKQKEQFKKKEKEYEANQFNFLPKCSRIFCQMQMKARSTKKFRWSDEERKFAMSIYYKSPTTYKYMRRNGLILPSVSMVKKWFQSIHFLPGLNDVFLEHLGMKCSTMTGMERACSIVFDEMSIKKCMEYNKSLDYIEGFQDIGGEEERKKTLGTHALVIMIRGLYSKWKLPLAYFITGKGMEPEDMKRIMEESVKKVVSIGFDPKVMVCDQGPENRGFYSHLGVSSENYAIEIGGKKIFCMYDVPHLFKSLRNNLLTGIYMYDGKIISLTDVRETYNIDARSKTARAMPKITPCHLKPNKFKRMSCRLALQVFSRSVAAAIRAAHKTKELKSFSAENTANFIELLNDLFDSLNSSYLYDPNPNKRPLADDTAWHFERFKEVIGIFKKIEKVTYDKKTKKNKYSRPPCFDGLLMTIRAISDLFEQESDLWKCKYSKDLKKNHSNTPTSKPFKKPKFFLMTRRLNQDPLENFFSVVRQKNGYNRNPTVRLFRCSFGHIATMGFFKYSSLGNCEDDNDTFLNLDQTANNAKEKTSTVAEIENETEKQTLPTEIIDDEIDNDHDDEDAENEDEKKVENEIEEEDPFELSSDFIEDGEVTLESLSNVYVAGYLAHAGLKDCKCSKCQILLLDSKEKGCLPDEQQALLVFRTFENITDSERGLKVPSVTLVNVTKLVLNLCTEVFTKSPEKRRLAASIFETAEKKIKQKFPSFYESNESSSECPETPCKQNKDKIIQLLIRTKIYKDCKRLSSKMYSNTEKPHARLSIVKNN